MKDEDPDVFGVFEMDIMMLRKDPDPDIIIFRGRKGSREPRSSHVRQPASGIAPGDLTLLFYMSFSSQNEHYQSNSMCFSTFCIFAWRDNCPLEIQYVL